LILTINGVPAETSSSANWRRVTLLFLVGSNGRNMAPKMAQFNTKPACFVF
jgi:hypothetical protein